MRTSRNLIHGLLAFCALLVVSSAAFAADPGLPYPANSEVSDQKAGSVLFYNTYTSSASAPAQENTRVNITNTSSQFSVALHVFFVEGTSCGVADTFICLTRNQTASFTTSDADPGTRGYIVAVAVNFRGLPINFNFLIGDEYVKYASGHAANLGAEAIAAVGGEDDGAAGSAGSPISGGAQDEPAVSVAFDGTPGHYNRLPRVLADDSIPSRLDGNDTKLIVNRVGGGNLVTGAATLGTLFAVIYDDAENTFSTSFTGQCHLELSLGANNLPRVIGGWNALIPAGHTGWMKFWSTSDIAILGSAINFNAGAGGFNGGHNLHKLTLTATGTLVIPVFPASCEDVQLTVN
jgi:hypothetical protein